MRCGLLGRTLGHSYSPDIHAMLGNYSYELFEKEPEELKDFLLHGDYTGLNVTIPYKKDVIPYLDVLSPAAKKIGAVNTIVRCGNGMLFGHNTDYYGFSSLVSRSGFRVEGKKVLILGSGGASNTAVKVMEGLGAIPIVISRTGPNNYSNLSIHCDARFLVNATPVGMYPNNGQSPVDLKLFPQLEGVLDMIYNPAKTQLLLDAEALGIANDNGLWMLVAQAKEAAEYFTGCTINDSVMEPIYRNLCSKMKNIVLIGMPGCGKSSISSLLAAHMNRKTEDSDAEVVRIAGKPIPQIIGQDGEEAFRAIESEALASLGKQSSLVIATGGGIVTKMRNYPLLHQNGVIFWLDRNIDLLPTAGRPLSIAYSPQKLYEQRKDLYAQFADAVIDNNGSPEQTVAQIIAKWEELA